MEFVREFNKLNIIIKFILTFIFGPIIPGVYRILKGRVLTGILYIVTFGYCSILWIIDLMHIALYNKYKLFV